MNHSKVGLIQDNIFKIFFILCDCLSHCKMSSVLPPTPITTHNAINQKFLKSPSLGGVGPPKNQYSRLSHRQLKWHFSFPSCLSDPSFSFNGLLSPFSYALSTMAILQGMVLGYLLLPRHPPTAFPIFCFASLRHHLYAVWFTDSKCAVHTSMHTALQPSPQSWYRIFLSLQKVSSASLHLVSFPWA